MNLQVLPRNGRGLGPGTWSQDLTDGEMSKSDVSIAAWVDLAREPCTGQDFTGFEPRKEEQ